MPETHTVLRWEAYEHEHIKRESDWFWALGVLTVCAALISILFRDVLFAIVLVVAAFTIALIARTPPDLMRFEVSHKGIRINGKLHRYHEVLSFWVEEEHGDKHGRPLLLVDTTKFLSPNLIIPIEDVDPHELRLFLKHHAKETHMTEPFSHKILEFLGL